MRTFGFLGTFDPNGGVYGLGRVTGSPMRDASVTTRFAVVDGLHPIGHNGLDLDDGIPDAEIICPLDGIVAQNYANVWPGPGPKVLYSYDDQWGHHEKVVQPGDLDRGGNVLVLIHEGPWRLPDGRTALHAATGYYHLREMPPLPIGTRLRAGDVLGIKGTTGISTAPHLHWNLAFQFEAAGIFPPDMGLIPNLTEPTQFIGLPVADVAGPLVEGAIVPGLSLVAVTGTVAQLDMLVASTVTATVGGRMLTYIVGAPAFVNEEFIAAFPGGLTRTPVIVKQ